jgi:hypothetical protein
MAFANEHITASAIEATEFMDLARKYRVTGVPTTVVNETVEIMGALPEEMFVRAALQRGAADSRRRTCGQRVSLLPRFDRSELQQARGAYFGQRGLVECHSHALHGFTLRSEFECDEQFDALTCPAEVTRHPALTRHDLFSVDSSGSVAGFDL